jgi:chromosome segregation protein
VYLKRIEIKGFKSFADNTELILQPGINVIVGPNGCGKSNIVDAVRWCLGESNIRHLRGQKGEDVIFNGTDNKRALGMALVELSIENGDGILPLDYDEVNISRKLFRSGESEFYINKSRVRMKDIYGLFTGTGLGRKGYSIVGQGELEQVLNGQGLDRRFILEEASGIIKYRQQRDEVKNRLLNTKQDLNRLRDILVELKQRRDDLEIKSDKARKHIKLQEEKQELEENILKFEICKVNGDLFKKNELVREKQQEMDRVQGQLYEQEQQISLEENRLLQNRDIINAGKDEKHDLERRIADWNNEARLREERIRNYLERLAAAAEEEKKYRLMLEKLKEELLSRSEDYRKQKCQLEDLKNGLEKINLQLKQLERKMEESQRFFEMKKVAVFERMQEESKINNQLLQTDAQERKLREKKERLHLLSGELKAKISQKEELLHNLSKEKQLFEKEIPELQKQLKELEEEKQESERMAKARAAEYTRLNEAEFKMNKQLLVIDDMDRKLEGYSWGVKSVLEASARGELRGIKGLVGEVIDVPGGLETAIEVALGRKLENIIVSSSENARDAIEYLKGSKRGRVTFLPLDILLSNPVPLEVKRALQHLDGVLGLAADLIKYGPDYGQAMNYLMGRVVLVKDMNTGIKLFKSIKYPLQIVSLEGELISVSGAMTGGSRERVRETPLQRKKERRNLQEQLAGVKKKLELNKAQGEKIAGILEIIQQKIDVIQKKLIEQQFRFEVVRQEAGQLIQDIELAGRDWQNNIDELAGLELSYGKLLLEREALENNKENIHGLSESEAEELEKWKETIGTNKRDYQVHIERQKSYQEQLESKLREIENIEKNIEQFRQVENSYQKSRMEASELQERLSGLIQKESDKIEESKEIIKQEKIKLNQIKENLLSRQKEGKECQESINNLRREILPLRQVLIQIEGSSRNAEINIARLETELSVLRHKWKIEVQKPEPESANEQPPFSLTQVRGFRQQTEVLALQLEELGPVDPESLSEFEAVHERYQFIHQQYEDLLRAQDSLNQLLQQTEKIMAEQFNDFILLAQKSFSYTFQDIFGGGEASLRIEAGKESLEAGIEIEVKLPGKKTQALNLLSGGERALTCIAFIFALLGLKPAPFCILDEIDASLDETNLIRFGNFIKKMAEKMQYIIISHRQSTIERAENIYGVTMPEKGVSRVLTLNISELEELAG